MPVRSCPGPDVPAPTRRTCWRRSRSSTRSARSRWRDRCGRPCSSWVSKVPRGPLPSTRDNPSGLTQRQSEVAQLVVQGMTSAEIAAHLVVSIRTVDRCACRGDPRQARHPVPSASWSPEPPSRHARGDSEEERVRPHVRRDLPARRREGRHRWPQWTGWPWRCLTAWVVRPSPPIPSCRYGPPRTTQSDRAQARPRRHHIVGELCGSWPLLLLGVERRLDHLHGDHRHVVAASLMWGGRPVAPRPSRPHQRVNGVYRPPASVATTEIGGPGMRRSGAGATVLEHRQGLP